MCLYKGRHNIIFPLSLYITLKNLNCHFGLILPTEVSFIFYNSNFFENGMWVWLLFIILFIILLFISWPVSLRYIIIMHFTYSCAFDDDVSVPPCPPSTFPLIATYFMSNYIVRVSFSSLTHVHIIISGTHPPPLPSSLALVTPFSPFPCLSILSSVFFVQKNK